MCGGRQLRPGCLVVGSLGGWFAECSAPSLALRCLFAGDCCAACALFRALCESVLLSCSEFVLLPCSNSLSWPSRSRCRVLAVTLELPCQ